jgi:hypothetical protein
MQHGIEKESLQKRSEAAQEAAHFVINGLRHRFEAWVSAVRT